MKYSAFNCRYQLLLPKRSKDAAVNPVNTSAVSISAISNNFMLYLSSNEDSLIPREIGRRYVYWFVFFFLTFYKVTFHSLTAWFWNKVASNRIWTCNFYSQEPVWCGWQFTETSWPFHVSHVSGEGRDKFMPFARTLVQISVRMWSRLANPTFRLLTLHILHL